VEQGGEELEAFALQGGAVLLGLLLFFLTFRTMSKGSAKLLPIILALLGIGVMVGGILYGQICLKQIDEEYKERRNKKGTYILPPTAAELAIVQRASPPPSPKRLHL
jgi:hypothetical protein